MCNVFLSHKHDSRTSSDCSSAPSPELRNSSLPYSNTCCRESGAKHIHTPVPKNMKLYTKLHICKSVNEFMRESTPVEYFFTNVDFFTWIFFQHQSVTTTVWICCHEFEMRSSAHCHCCSKCLRCAAKGICICTVGQAGVQSSENPFCQSEKQRMAHPSMCLREQSAVRHGPPKSRSSSKVFDYFNGSASFRVI